MKILTQKLKPGVIAIISILILGALGTGIYFGVRNLALQSELDGFQATSDATNWHLIIKNTSSIALDDDEVYGYLYTYEILDHYDLVTDFTQSDYDDLPYTAFVLDKSEIEHNDTILPKANTFHWLKLNGTGFNEEWINLDAKPLGDVAIVMIPTPSSVGMTAYSSAGNSTILNTTDQMWTVVLNMLDSDSEIDTKCGYSPYYNFSAVTKMSKLEESRQYNLVILDFNSTALSSSDVVWEGAYSDVKIESDKMIFMFNENFLGQNIFNFEISDDLGTDFELEAITFQRGTVESYSQIAAA